jgi:hypothetical protein
MKWQDLMTRFAEVVGRVMAEQWLAEQSARRQQKVETDCKVVDGRRSLEKESQSSSF